MSSAFDAYRTSYDRTVQDSISFSGLQHDFFLRAKIAQLRMLFDAHFGGERPRLLDVGCGVGLLHRALRPLTAGLTGTDLSGEALARARAENPGIAYLEQAGDALPCDRASFDASLAVCVFHHVPPGGRRGLLAEMVRVTRLGGLVVLIEHNPWNPLTRLAVARCPFDHDAVLLDAAAGRRLMIEGGLQDIAGRHFLLLPTERGWARGVERRTGRLPLGAQYLIHGTVPAR